MEIKCALCGKPIEVAVELSKGQHVRCPFCKGKFSYEINPSPGMVPEVSASDVIDPAEMKKALGTCMKDPELQRLYKSAPEGAQKVLKLSFYSTVFPSKIDGHKFRANLRALAPALTKDDLKFLIRFETDEYLKKYFKGLLSGDAPMLGMQSINVPQRKLGVIRNVSTGGSVDLNAEAMKKRLEDGEKEREESKRRAFHAKKMELADARKRLLIQLSVIGCAIFLGIVCLVLWQRARARREAAVIAEYERLKNEEARRQEDEARRQELERQEALERKEQDRLEREKRRQESETRRQEQLRKREEERMAAKALQEQEQKARAEERALREKYLGVIDGFRNTAAKPWSALPRTSRPGAVAGVFYCAVPVLPDDYSIYEISSATDGTYAVFEMFRDQPLKPIEAKKYEEMIERSGCLVFREGSVYFIASKSNRNGWPMPTCDGFVPAELCMGKTYAVARKLRVPLDGMGCEIEVKIPDAKNPLSVGRFGLTSSVRNSTIVDIVKKWVRSTTKAPSVRKLRKTIVFYDGGVIKKDMNGVMYVPRNPTCYDARWSDLAEGARQQEMAAVARQGEAQRQFEENVAKKCERTLRSVVINIKVMVR